MTTDMVRERLFHLKKLHHEGEVQLDAFKV